LAEAGDLKFPQCGFESLGWDQIGEAMMKGYKVFAVLGKKLMSPNSVVNGQIRKDRPRSEWKEGVAQYHPSEIYIPHDVEQGYSCYLSLKQLKEHFGDHFTRDNKVKLVVYEIKCALPGILRYDKMIVRGLIPTKRVGVLRLKRSIFGDLFVSRIEPFKKTTKK
jgi:hypothetical protein